MRRISVVLPVYNERESIAPCLRGLWAALATEDHEILVCYDSEEDSTLPAIAAMPDRPASVRLVRNSLGRGALNAIRTGFQAAQGDVVVTSMADLSDPPEVILEMAKAIRSGADVVSGSRYMRGGSQRGGPWLKRTLSRIAGVSLRWLGGLGTYDATSNFRAYSRSFLDTVQVESRGGFEIALELTVKAHLAGKVVTEVPSSWVDRSSGKSNFRMWRWMPSYLRWYLRAMAAPLFVLAAWIAMLGSTSRFVAVYASPVPIGDDFTIVPWIGGSRPLTLEWLWSAHNEHRIPLPRLVFVGMMKLTNDLRSVMFLEVALLAAASLALIFAARRRRGRTSVTDAFFPFLLLGWGQYENLLNAFQIALVLPAVIATTILALVAGGPPVPDRRSAIRIGILLFALPLCGAPGLLHALPIVLWLVLAGASASRSRDRARRRSARHLLAMSASVVFLIGLYFVGYAAPTPSPYYAGPGRTIFSAIDVLALGAGILGPTAMPIARWLLVGLGLATLAALVAQARASAEERWRELGILACAVGSIALALGIGWGRGAFPAGGVSLRYVTLSAPFLALLCLAWCREWTGIAGRIVQYGLCFGMAALSPGLFAQARDFGEKRQRATENLVRDADAGLLPEELAERHAEAFYMGEGNFAAVLEHMRILGMPPYRTEGTGPELDPRSARPFFRWSVQPIETHSDRPITRRKTLDVWVVLVHAPTELVFEIPPGARAAHGGFGVNPLAYSNPGRSLCESRFSIERVASGDDREILFERILDPVNRPEDRTIQRFALELPSNASGRLVLRLASAGVDDESIDRGFWTGLEFGP